MNRIQVYCYYDLDIEIQLKGTPDGLRELASLLRHPPAEAKLPEAPPTSYPAFLTHVSVRLADTKFTLSVASKTLIISGGQQFLETFARNCLYMANKDVHPRGDHIHEEYYPDHPYISKESLTCIISII